MPRLAEVFVDSLLDYLSRFWSDMVGRTEGPMTFRFLLQPIMAIVMATIDGFKDARIGRRPYFQRLVHGVDSAHRIETFREGFTAVTRILLLGVAMDVIYQFKVFGNFRYPVETLVIAIALAFIPYMLLRGPLSRLARRWKKPSP